MKDPARIAALIVQNGDIYEDALGPKYEALNRIGANRQRKNTTSSGPVLPRSTFAQSFKSVIVWCCRTGLNCRPLPYQGRRHLPLSPSHY